MVFIGHVGSGLTVGAVRIQNNEQSMYQGGEDGNECSHEEKDWLDQHYEHGQHRNDHIEVGDTDDLSGSGCSRARDRLHIQLAPHNRGTDRSMIRVRIQDLGRRAVKSIVVSISP